MKKIYLGLDIGTSSCGWALTDNEYNLQKIAGKDAWGVRLFDEAKTKADRRLNRTNKRRMVRKKLQNMWLRELFEEEIQKVDELFFYRLKYSNLYQEDKLLMNDGLDSKYSLFNDVLGRVYNDKNYYKEYKTVYHLRKKLLVSPADDVRLLYLAIHSILTHRGHFLSGSGLNDNSDSSNDLIVNIQNLFSKLDEITEDETFSLKCENLSFLDNLLSNFENLKSIKNIKEKLAEDLNAKSKLEKEIVSIFISGKSSTNKIFTRIGKEDAINFEFDSDSFEDEVYGKLVDQLSEDELEVINLLKNIFSSIQLKRILGQNSYVCQAMVDKYEKHKKQLNEFKKFVKKYYPSKKKLFFSQVVSEKTKNLGDICNYAKYINFDMKNHKKNYFDKTATQEQFYKFVKKQLETLQVECAYNQEEFEQEKQYFLDLIDKNDFLLKIRAKENSVIPNGLYVKELKQILKINSQKFEFLSKKDEDGLTIADKIISIIEFRVPYFVGPIGTYKNEPRVNGWAEKECDLELRPWTLQKIVNYDKAEDAFIQRMTNKCTYLFKEDVLPKESLLYSKFCVLNDLNVLKINGNAISVELKQLIFNKLFKNYKKVTVKKLKEFLVSENIFSKEDAKNAVITNVDTEFTNNYTSFVVLKERLGEDFISAHQEDLEKIIQYHTVISDKTRLEKRIEREFNYLSKENIKFLKSLNFTKWGRFSKKFLTGIYFADKKTGEIFNVIDAMWNTNHNLMELMGSGFTLVDKLSEQEQKQTRDLAYQDVEDLYCSPAVKRGAWQALQIINEIKGAIGKYPDKIFVEVSRGSNFGDVSAERRKKLAKLYKTKELKKLCEDYSIEYNQLLEELNKNNNANLRSDRLFLYFLQLGKCVYTGEPIDIENLNLYDIDHIIPQSKVKDDSLDNRVLVSKHANESKGDGYPIWQDKPEWVQKQRPFWEFLNEQGFMTNEKLARLIRTEPFTESDANDFVNRQLVITNQETKAVIDLLKKVVDNPNDIVFSKARFVSDFRNKYKIFKSRNVNNFHHAKDAYLNIAVGDVLRNRFTEGFWKREKEDCNKGITANISNLFDCYVRNPNNGSIVWKGKGDVKKVIQVCNKNSCLISYMPFSKSNGDFYKQTIHKSSNKDANTEASVSLKGNTNNPLASVEKYGGYNNINNAYFMVVESQNKKGKITKTIECVPIMISYAYRKDNPQKIIEYVEKQNNIKITRVIFDKLKFSSLLKIDGALYRITGKTGNSYKLLKATEWHIDNKYVGYIKILEKYLQLAPEIQEKLQANNDKIIVSPAVKEKQKELAITREQNLELYNLIISQLSKSIYNISSIKIVYNRLVQEKETFKNLSLSQQSELLQNLINYIGGAHSVDLRLIGGAKDTGTIQISKDITGKNISLICKSVSGIYQKEIKL